jgi:hypothetical protein
MKKASVSSKPYSEENLTKYENPININTEKIEEAKNRLIDASFEVIKQEKKLRKL